MALQWMVFLLFGQKFMLLGSLMSHELYHQPDPVIQSAEVN